MLPKCKGNFPVAGGAILPANRFGPLSEPAVVLAQDFFRRLVLGGKTVVPRTA